MRLKYRILNLLLVITIFSYSQEKKTYNVAIVVYEGVELFDFAEPGEVFAAARRGDVAEKNICTNRM